MRDWDTATPNANRLIESAMLEMSTLNVVAKAGKDGRMTSSGKTPNRLIRSRSRTVLETIVVLLFDGGKVER
jgi:hypothetical protein